MDLLLSLSLFLLFLLPSLATGTYNVVSFGARGNGRTDSTRGFVSAWAFACGSVTPATIYVPPGRYLLKQVIFAGPCRNNRITIQIDGTLVASSNYAEFPSGKWLLFNRVKGVAINGGTIDGQGAGLWACKMARRNCPGGARSLAIQNAQDVWIKGLRSINSQFYHITVNGCKNINLRGIQLVAPDASPNTDGIHVQHTTGLTITNSAIKTGDDCISIGPGTRNMWVERVACGPGHGISIGSLAQTFDEEGVQNVTVKSVELSGTQNGLRIKTWGRPSRGFVRGVRFLNIRFFNVKNPIIIDQNYCPSNRNCPAQQSGTKISGVIYKNIKGTSATPIAVKFDCSKVNPCNGIRMQDVKLSYLNQKAQSICKNAVGSSDGLVDPPSCL